METDYTSSCPAFEKWWDENCINWLPIPASDELKGAIYPAAKSAYEAALKSVGVGGKAHNTGSMPCQQQSLDF
jgi:hypothetical protein